MILEGASWKTLTIAFPLVLTGILIARGSALRFPIFTAYVLLSLVDAILSASGMQMLRPHMLRTVKTIQNIAAFAVCLELFEICAHRMKWKLHRATLVSGVVFGCAAILYTVTQALGLASADACAMGPLTLTSALLVLIAITAIFLWSQRSGIFLEDSTFGIAAGLSALSGGQAAVCLLQASFGARFALAEGYLLQGVYVVSFIIWSRYLLRIRPTATAISPEMRVQIDSLSKRVRDESDRSR